MNRLSKKRIAIFSTDTPYYFLFIENRAQLNGVKRHPNHDLDFNDYYILYNNKLFEGFNGSTTKSNINNEVNKQALCIEFREGVSTLIKEQLWRWEI